VSWAQNASDLVASCHFRSCSAGPLNHTVRRPGYQQLYLKVCSLNMALNVIDVDQQNRLLQHGIHEETVFYNRLNFFSVFEGVLLAALVSLDAQQSQLPELSWLLPLLGIVVTSIWWYTQARKRKLVEVLGHRIEQALPEFRDTIALMTGGKKRPFSASTLITHCIPAIFLLLWTYLLARLLMLHCH